MIGHVDADCFYVSAERVRSPGLRGMPVGVLGNHGACIIAKSYEMKAAGVTTGMPIAVILALVLITTMFLSDIINNAATVLVMAPIAVSISGQFNSAVEPFLMAVAVGASCAFLTPIGHQSNTLVMGPGGYHFGDYWRMGLPLEILIVMVSIPSILFFWPPF